MNIDAFVKAFKIRSRRFAPGKFMTIDKIGLFERACGGRTHCVVPGELIWEEAKACNRLLTGSFEMYSYLEKEYSWRGQAWELAETTIIVAGPTYESVISQVVAWAERHIDAVNPQVEEDGYFLYPIMTPLGRDKQYVPKAK